MEHTTKNTSQQPSFDDQPLSPDAAASEASAKADLCPAAQPLEEASPLSSAEEEAHLSSDDTRPDTVDDDVPPAEHEDAVDTETAASGNDADPCDNEAAKKETHPSEEDPDAPAEGSAEAEQSAPEKDDFAPILMGEAAPEPEIPNTLPTEAPLPAGPAATLFNGLSYIALPVLLLFSAAISFAEVWQIRDLWFSDEVRLADAFMRLMDGDWLALTMNGQMYPDKPPLYFWFMQGLTFLPGVNATMAIFLAVAISHALFVAAIWGLARGTGHDRREAFAAGLVALGTLYISGAACYPRMDLLFSALIVLGMTCLYRGWIKTFSPFWLATGFLLLGASVLVKGPLGLGFTVITSILFLFWRGTPGRLNGKDGLPGFLLMLLMIAAWLGTLYINGHADYLSQMLGQQLAGRVTGTGSHVHMWWYYLAAVPVLWLPWVFLILFVNWLGVLRGISTVWKSRKTNGGSSWLWIWFVTGIALLSAIPSKIAVYALPLLAPLAVLTGRSLLRLTPQRSRWFFRFCALFLLALGLALAAIDVYPYVEGYLPSGWKSALPEVIITWVSTLHGTAAMGGILVLTALILLFFTRTGLPGGALLITSAGMIALLPCFHLMVTPSMESLLSPKAQATVMAEKMKEGYAAAAFRVYPGAYAWHINLLMPDTEKRLAVPDLADAAARDAWLAQNPKAVMAMPKSEWDEWTDKPASATVLATAWMVHKPYVVAAIDAPVPAAPQDKDAQPEIAPVETKAPADATTPAAPENSTATTSEPEKAAPEQESSTPAPETAPEKTQPDAGTEGSHPQNEASPSQHI